MIQVLGKTDSIIQGLQAYTYSLLPNRRELVARSLPDGKVVNVSFFAKHMSVPFTLRVQCVGPHSSQTKDFKITKEWTRFDLAMNNDIAIKPMEVFFTALTVAIGPVQIAIEAFQTVEYLYAGPVIGQGPVLPADAALEGQGERREADKISLKIPEPITSKSATIITVFSPQWDTAELTEDEFKTVFSLWSNAASEELSVGISGAHGSRFVVRRRVNEEEKILDTEMIAGRRQYFLCLVFRDNAAALIVNGHVVLNFDFEDIEIYDEFFLGSTKMPGGGNLDGVISQVAYFSVSYLMPKILSIYKSLCPDHPHYLLDYINNSLHLALVEQDEADAFYAIQEKESFYNFVQQLTFSLAKIYHQFPPGSVFTEENVRDYVSALVTRPDFDPVREEYTKIGRTDLSFIYPNTEGLQKDKYPVEFKIWGRAGWNEAPSQPLKYMGESERFGAFVMIDRRKKANISQFEEIVGKNESYLCTNISKFGFLETNLLHFYSFHRDERYAGLRVMVNFYLPIPG